MNDLKFKYQTQFTCRVPEGYTTIKDFSEMIATDLPQTIDTILQTIKLSFESAGVNIERLDLSNDPIIGKKLKLKLSTNGVTFRVQFFNLFTAVIC